MEKTSLLTPAEKNELDVFLKDDIAYRLDVVQHYVSGTALPERRISNADSIDILSKATKLMDDETKELLRSADFDFYQLSEHPERAQRCHDRYQQALQRLTAE